MADFVRSGWVYLSPDDVEDDNGNVIGIENPFQLAGNHGFLWSSLVGDSWGGFNLGIWPTSVAPDYYIGRYYALSLRCLSTVLDR